MCSSGSRLVFASPFFASAGPCFIPLTRSVGRLRGLSSLSQSSSPFFIPVRYLLIELSPHPPHRVTPPPPYRRQEARDLITASVQHLDTQQHAASVTPVIHLICHRLRPPCTFVAAGASISVRRALSSQRHEFQPAFRSHSEVHQTVTRFIHFIPFVSICGAPRRCVSKLPRNSPSYIYFRSRKTLALNRQCYGLRKPGKTLGSCFSCREVH